MALNLLTITYVVMLALSALTLLIALLGVCDGGCLVRLNSMALTISLGWMALAVTGLLSTTPLISSGPNEMSYLLLLVPTVICIGLCLHHYIYQSPNRGYQHDNEVKH